MNQKNFKNKYQPTLKNVITPPPIDPKVLALLSPKEIDKLKESYTRFQDEESLLLPIDKLGPAMRLLGYMPTQAQVKEYLQNILEKKRGDPDFLSTEDLIKAVHQHKVEETPIITYHEFVQALNILADGGTTLIESDLVEALLTQGEPFNIEEITYFLNFFNPKGSEEFNYENALGRMRKIEHSKTKKKKNEPIKKPKKKKGKK